MKILKILIPIVIIAVAVFFLLKKDKISQNDITNTPSPSPASNEIGEPGLPQITPDMIPPPPDRPTGVLLKSDNPAKGNLMLKMDIGIGRSDWNTSVDTTYIKTSRDYSALIGKRVQVKFKDGADALDFVLDDIVPLE